MPTIESIKKSADFKVVLDKSNKSVSTSLVMFSNLNDLSIAKLRLGLIVSKKNGIAVVRNRIKRRLRSAFAKINEQYQINPSDIVLIARRPSFDISFDQLINDLVYCLKKNKLI